MEQSKFIYTIGHGNRPLGELIEAVLSYDIDYLVDVRSTPYSSYCPQFARESISAAINATGRTRYAYLGDQLGGYPKEPEYQSSGKVDYDKYSQSERFRHGIARLKKGCQELGLRLCIMCSESDPTNCHRTRLISNELEKIGVAVRHIVFLPQDKTVDMAEDKDMGNDKGKGADKDGIKDVGNDTVKDVGKDTLNNDTSQNATCEKRKIKTTLLTHGQVIAGAVKRLKESGVIPRDNYPSEGLFS